MRVGHWAAIGNRRQPEYYGHNLPGAEHRVPRSEKFKIGQPLGIGGAETYGYKFREAFRLPPDRGVRKSGKNVLPQIFADGRGERAGVYDLSRCTELRFHSNRRLGLAGERK